MQRIEEHLQIICSQYHQSKMRRYCILKPRIHGHKRERKVKKANILKYVKWAKIST